MEARVLGIVRTTAARSQIGFVAVERFSHGDGAAFVDGVAGLPPRERARLVDGLQVGEDVWRAGRLEIVGERHALDPLGTAVGDAHRPGTCASVAAIAERDAGAN